jgi:hypothetical protein
MNHADCLHIHLPCQVSKTLQESCTGQPAHGSPCKSQWSGCAVWRKDRQTPGAVSRQGDTALPCPAGPWQHTEERGSWRHKQPKSLIVQVGNMTLPHRRCHNAQAASRRAAAAYSRWPGASESQRVRHTIPRSVTTHQQTKTGWARMGAHLTAWGAC